MNEISAFFSPDYQIFVGKNFSKKIPPRNPASTKSLTVKESKNS